MTKSDDLHPSRWMRTRPFSREYVRRHNSESNAQGMVTSERLNALVTKVMGPDYNAAIMKVPFERRPADPATMLGNEASLAGHVAKYVKTGRNAFALSPTLAAALAETDLAGVRFDDVRLPFGSFYLSMRGALDEGLPGSDNVIDGAYVTMINASDGPILEIVLTTRRLDTDPRSSGRWPFNRDPYFYFPLRPRNGDETFEEALDRSISTKQINVDDSLIESDPEVTVEEIDGRSVEVVHAGQRNEARRARDRAEALPAAKRALALVVNSLAWLTAQPEDAAEAGEWPADAPASIARQTEEGSKSSRRSALARMLDQGYTRIKVLGRSLEREMREAYGAGWEVDPHWRRGHWRRQAHGVGYSERSLKWIRPTIVRADLGEPKRGHLYQLGGEG